MATSLQTSSAVQSLNATVTRYVGYIAPLILVVLFLGCGRSAGDQRGTSDRTEPAATDSREGGASVATKSAPQFNYPTLDGGRFRMADQLGKVVLVNFWATWCAPCVREIPELNALRSDLGPQGLVVLGISMDDVDTAEVVDFAETHAMKYPVIIDQGRLADQFGGVYGLPTSFVVDTNGDIVHRVIGIIDPARIRPVLEGLLPEAQTL